MEPRQLSDKKSLFSGIVLLLATIGFVWLVAYDLLVRGPFAWHIAQPSAFEGGIEALALTLFVCASAVFPRRWVVAIGIAASLLYLRRHNAELTALAAWLYIEFLAALGRSALKQLGDRQPQGFMAEFMAGLSLLLLFTFLMSLFQLALPLVLLVSLVAVGAMAALSSPSSLAVVRVYHRARPESKAEGLLAGLTLSWLLILAARTANILGHDSLWYLGRGDVVFAPNGNVFENLHFVSPVHYFPKLWETSILPITAFDQLRVQEGVAVGFMVICAALVWKLCCRLSVPRPWCFSATLLLLTLPAWANTALQIKTDVVGTLFLLAMVVFLVDWLQARKLAGLIYAIAAATLAVSCKYTAIPFVAFTFLFVVTEYSFSRLSTPQLIGDEGLLAPTIVFLLSATVTIVLLLRTWSLTGVPTVGPDPILKIWNFFGLHILEPAGTLRWTKPQAWGDVPRLFYEWLFAPSYMQKIRISWQGNYWLLFLVFGGVAAALGVKPERYGKSHLKRLMVLLSLAGLIVALAWRYLSRGGDGNYYMFPIALVTCISMALIVNTLGRSRLFGKFLLASVVIFSLFHAVQGFIGAAWSKPGTRAWDIKFDSSPLAPGVWRRDILRKQGLAKIAVYLDDRDPSDRLIAFGFNHLAVLLPVATEDIRAIRHAKPEYVENAQAFLAYAEKYGIRYLLLTKDVEKVRMKVLLTQLHAIAEERNWQKVDEADAVLYMLP